MEQAEISNKLTNMGIGEIKIQFLQSDGKSASLKIVPKKMELGQYNKVSVIFDVATKKENGMRMLEKIDEFLISKFPTTKDSTYKPIIGK